MGDGGGLPPPPSRHTPPEGANAAAMMERMGLMRKKPSRESASQSAAALPPHKDNPPERGRSPMQDGEDAHHPVGLGQHRPGTEVVKSSHVQAQGQPVGSEPIQPHFQRGIRRELHAAGGANSGVREDESDVGGRQRRVYRDHATGQPLSPGTPEYERARAAHKESKRNQRERGSSRSPGGSSLVAPTIEPSREEQERELDLRLMRDEDAGAMYGSPYSSAGARSGRAPPPWHAGREADMGSARAHSHLESVDDRTVRMESGQVHGQTEWQRSAPLSGRSGSPSPAGNGRPVDLDSFVTPMGPGEDKMARHYSGTPRRSAGEGGVLSPRMDGGDEELAWMKAYYEGKLEQLSRQHREELSLVGNRERSAGADEARSQARRDMAAAVAQLESEKAAHIREIERDKRAITERLEAALAAEKNRFVLEEGRWRREMEEERAAGQRARMEAETARLDEQDMKGRLDAALEDGRQAAEEDRANAHAEIEASKIRLEQVELVLKATRQAQADAERDARATADDLEAARRSLAGETSLKERALVQVRDLEKTLHEKRIELENCERSLGSAQRDIVHLRGLVSDTERLVEKFRAENTAAQRELGDMKVERSRLISESSEAIARARSREEEALRLGKELNRARNVEMDLNSRLARSEAGLEMERERERAMVEELSAARRQLEQRSIEVDTLARQRDEFMRAAEEARRVATNNEQAIARAEAAAAAATAAQAETMRLIGQSNGRAAFREHESSHREDSGPDWRPSAQSARSSGGHISYVPGDWRDRELRSRGPSPTRYASPAEGALTEQRVPRDKWDAPGLRPQPNIDDLDKMRGFRPHMVSHMGDGLTVEKGPEVVPYRSGRASSPERGRGQSPAPFGQDSDDRDMRGLRERDATPFATELLSYEEREKKVGSLNSQLMTLQQERTGIESDLGRIQGSGRNIAERKVKQEKELRVEAINRDINNVKTSLRRLGAL